MKEAVVSGENSMHGRYLNVIHNSGRKPKFNRLIGRRKRIYEKNLPSLNGMEM